jgi:DnaA N-terminal domain
MPAGDGRARARAQGTLDSPFFFEGIESPNGTIFPDALLDLVMPFLTPTEWKVCTYVVRRTFGWKKASDRISLEQICHGIVRRDGSRLDHGTQLDRKTAIKALRGLEGKGVIVAQRNYSDAHGFEPTTYGLRFRGQPATRTLGEKFPQGEPPPGEDFPQGEVEDLPEAPGEALHQASPPSPPALVEVAHPQATPGTTNTTTSGSTNKRARKTTAASPLPTTPRAEAAHHPGAAANPHLTARRAEAADHPATAPLPPAATPLPTGASPAVSLPPTAVRPAASPPGAPPAPDGALWTTVLARLQQQMTAANYRTWLADTRPLGRRGATLVVGAPSSFVREWLQTRFRLLVRRALQDAAPDLDDVVFEVLAPPPPPAES